LTIEKPFLNLLPHEFDKLYASRACNGSIITGCFLALVIFIRSESIYQVTI
jgi:hypothetical protein